jgi:hypothetical protein
MKGRMRMLIDHLDEIALRQAARKKAEDNCPKPDSVLCQYHDRHMSVAWVDNQLAAFICLACKDEDEKLGGEKRIPIYRASVLEIS